jgi:hypothetical protein
VKFVLLCASHILWALTNPHWTILYVAFWISTAVYFVLLFVTGFVVFCTKMLSISAMRDAWISEWNVDFTPTHPDAENGEDDSGLANGHYQFAFFSEVGLHRLN